ncbi:MAG: hypothetical protein JWQ35_402 [Bacteriovoracaceae bacterium]|nr:hypothetical protein [Bacteriovoracaceae bacterium]
MNLVLSILFSLIQVAPAKNLPQVKIKGTTFQVEVARSESEWQKGLMFREHLAPNEGMLFFGNTERPQAFWMKNTLVSLDIIFISRNKKIVSIAKNTKPLSEEPLPSAAPAQYVLEILAGQATAHQLKAGDPVEFVRIP